MPTDPNDIDDALAEPQAEGETAPGETVIFKAGDPADEPAADAEPSVEVQLAAAEDRVLRLQAELQNVMNRARRELSDARRYGPLDLARDLLPAIDNIDRALEAAEKSGEAKELAAGFKMVRQQLAESLSRHGCEPIDTTAGVEFDPTFHEAILQQPSEEFAAGAILHTAQSGFKLHDRVLRPAQVIVSSGPAES
ncbi:nucleotide exchange factor GrpE [Botrimarina sp.]|uniref:nucleotide exchange factor GrpE n=1 Tax=Botrimarina sp. TaxID=2795802 RepID=UPI0032EE1546